MNGTDEHSLAEWKLYLDSREKVKVVNPWEDFKLEELSIEEMQMNSYNEEINGE